MTDHDLKSILTAARTIAIVGLSDKPERDSYRVARYLQAHGYRIIPVNPVVESVLGEVSYAAVTDIPAPVDVVDIFRKPEAVGPIVAEAIAAGAKVVWMQLGVVNETAASVAEAIAAGAKVIWMQLGVVNETAASVAEAAGLQVVMDRCIKMEHERLLGA